MPERKKADLKIFGKGAVLILSFDIAPYLVGGIGTVSLEHIRQYRERGYEVVVLGPQAPGVPFPVQGVHYYGLPVRGNLRKLVLAFLRLPFVLLRHKPTLIVAIQGTYAGLLALLARALTRRPYFVLAHGNEFIRFRRQPFVRAALNGVYSNSNGVFANSWYTRSRLIEFGVEAGKIDVIYCGVDTGRYRPVDSASAVDVRRKYGVGAEDFLLVSFSRLDARKGHIPTLKALKRLAAAQNGRQSNSHRAVRYLIGGKGPHQPAIENEIHREGLANNVKLIGFVSGEEVPALLTDADVFIMPSVYLENEGSVEGFGIVFLEAAACRTCSIGGNTGGIADAIVDGETGFLVDGTDVAAIASRIEKLIEEPETGRRLSENAYLRVIGEFIWRYIVDREIGFINERLGSE